MSRGAERDGEKGTDPRLGLCLAGGGGLGFLHIGLLETLEELGIRPSLAAGTSMGAVMGAFYAAGVTSKDIRGILADFKWRKLAALTLPHHGLLSTHRMQVLFREHLGDMDIADLPIRLKIAAMNVRTGQLKQFSEGPLTKCLAASCAVPGLFEPVTIGGVEYYDAGPVYNLPLELLSGEGKKRIIAGNTIGENGLLEHPRTIEEVLYQTYLIQMVHQTRWRVGPRGWEGKKDEEVVLVDYHTGGANPARIEECKALIENTHALSLKVLEKAFGLQKQGKQPSEA